METTKTSHFTCQSKSFISIFFTCQVLACELQPFSCHDLANDIYSQTAKTVFSHLKYPRNPAFLGEGVAVSKPPSTCKFERSLLHVILCQITGKRSPWKRYFSPCKVLDFSPQNSVGTMYYKNYLCNEVDYNTGEIYPSLLHNSVGSCTSHFDLTNERRMKETGPVAWHKCPITQSCKLRREVLNRSKHDLIKFIKTQVGGLAGVWTCVLALGKLALFQLS